MASLQEEFPELESFATLSPVPLFTKWLSSIKLADVDLTLDSLTRALLERKCLQMKGNSEKLNELDLVLAALDGQPQWYRDSELNEALEGPLTNLMTQYLLTTRPEKQLPLCPVASFHLQNGAVLRRINWNADMSRKGLDNSAGMMVNYQYFLHDLEENMDNVSRGSLSHALRPYA